MSTTPIAKKRSFLAALGLSLALVLGALVPFLATSGSASAATSDCSTQGAALQRAIDHYSGSASQVTHAQKKLKKAKKHLKQAKKHHASKKVVKKAKKQVNKKKKRLSLVTTRLRNAAGGVGAANGALIACRVQTAPGGSTVTVDGPLAGTPLAPLCQLIDLPALCTTQTPNPADIATSLQNLIGLLTAGLSPATLSDPGAFAAAVEAGLESLIGSLNPGGGSLVTDLEKTVNDLVNNVVKILSNGSSTLPTDPTQILSLLTGGLGGAGLPGVDSLSSIPVLGPILQQLINTLTGSLPLSGI